ncbi:MAG: hypothetical protein JXR50_03285 [Prolixibacteraceae bacterium]|nr:hypothetical protein [Prolixibacteraceae bacterium]MBN2648745.1 hypothetical protein [Prolixibacteraceae bacterium]
MDKSRKITTIVLWVLMIISIAFFVYMFVSIDSETDPSAKAVELITLNINWAIILFAIGAVIILVFSLLQVFGDKSKLINSAVFLVLFAAIIGIGYALASSDIPNFFGVDKFIANGTVNETISRWIGTGLHVTYILLGGAFLSIIGFSTVKLFKR